MEQSKQPVKQFYYSEEEWGRLGCGPLPEKRDISKQKHGVFENTTVENTQKKIIT